jgi:hypothetical protein
MVCDPEPATVLRVSVKELFPEGRHPQAALAGLLLISGCWEESHSVAQDIGSAEGSYWHAIIHRMEPDFWNSGYWFRRVGPHQIFPKLYVRAAAVLEKYPNVKWRLKQQWDPCLFLEWCEEARTSPASEPAQLAREIQQAECELLLLWCALPFDAELP